MSSPYCLTIQSNGNWRLGPVDVNILPNKEYFYITSRHILYYDEGREINKYFAKFNYQVFGTVIIVKTDEDENFVNIEKDIIKKLPSMILDDIKYHGSGNCNDNEYRYDHIIDLT